MRVSGFGVTDSCELPCGCWELNPGPLVEQPVLLNTEPSLQPHAHNSYGDDPTMKQVWH